jgi:hypothetical protein
MEDEMDPVIHKSTDDARAGETRHVMRYVLGISLFLACAAMTVIWVSGAVTN